MPAKRKYPLGKTQVSILVTHEIHDAAQKVAHDWGSRYSYVYERGIDALAERGKSTIPVDPDKVALVQELTQNLNQQRDWNMLRAFAEFLRKNKDDHNFGIVKLILEKYTPEVPAKPRYALGSHCGRNKPLKALAISLSDS